VLVLPSSIDSVPGTRVEDGVGDEALRRSPTENQHGRVLRVLGRLTGEPNTGTRSSSKLDASVGKDAFVGGGPFALVMGRANGRCWAADPRIVGSAGPCGSPRPPGSACSSSRGATGPCSAPDPARASRSIRRRIVRITAKPAATKNNQTAKRKTSPSTYGSSVVSLEGSGHFSVPSWSLREERRRSSQVE
jgi:hypothetical protein